jgi:F-type H+-transporting ATPase subunit epsilon
VLKVSVISPERVLFEGEARSVVAPAYDGEVGILSQHAPMMTLLGRGVLRLEGGSAGDQRFDVEGGFLQVADDEVRVVTERASAATTSGAR